MENLDCLFCKIIKGDIPSNKVYEDDEERQMLRNAFRFRNLTARQVMVHRTRIVAAPVNRGVVELMEIALDSGHTRIPLYQDSIDTIIGFVHVKDLFRLYIAILYFKRSYIRLISG